MKKILFSRLSILFLACLVILPGCMAPKTGTGSTETNSSTSADGAYPANIKANFIKGCVSGMEGNTLLKEKGPIICECSFTEVEKNVALAEFMKFELAVRMGQEPDKTISDKITKAATDCTTQHLSPQ